MSKKRPDTYLINKALIGPFATASSAQAYMIFQENNPQHVTFLLDPHTEKQLIDYAANASDEKELFGQLRHTKPIITAYLHAKYGKEFDYTVQNVEFTERPTIEKPGTQTIGPFEFSARHSHANDMGVEFEFHSHIVNTSIRLGSLNGETVCVNDEAEQVLRRSLEQFFAPDHGTDSMETLGQKLFTHIQSTIDDLKQSGQLDKAIRLDAVLMDTPYDGSLDHPKTPILFITERVDAPDVTPA